MARNEHGLTSSGSDESVEHLDQAVDYLLHFDERCAEEVGKSIAVDPTCVMARVFRCCFWLLSTESQDCARAADELRALREAGLDVAANPREQGHIAAVDHWIRGDWHRARAALLDLQRAYPRDLLALIAGHQLDIFLGDLPRLRNRIAEALPAWTRDDRHYGVVLGMYAFGLEELGQLSRAGDVGQLAVTLDPRDAWGLHAVAHVHETRGEFHQGLDFLGGRVSDWGYDENFFRPHNWWHMSLFSLEAGETDNALAIYDRELHPDSVDAGSMQLLDAASLLWRLYLDGHDSMPRWRRLLDAWAPLSTVPHFMFNDMHVVMSYVGAGALDEAAVFVEERRAAVEAGRVGRAYADVAGRVGHGVCEALLEFGRGNYARTVELLLPLRDSLVGIGGSNAQRDVVVRTLLEAALRARNTGVVRDLLSSRLLERPCSPYNWMKLAQVSHDEGRFDAAHEARRRSAQFARVGARRDVGQVPADESDHAARP